MAVTTRPRRLAAFDWRTGLLAVLFGSGVVEVLIGAQLTRTGVLAVPTSTMLVVAGVWAALFAWCVVRPRLSEGEAMLLLCSVSTLLVLEAVLVPDTTWQWVCATVLFVVPVAGVMFLRRSLLTLLTAGAVVGQVVVVLARHQDPLLAGYALSAVLLSSVVPVVVVHVLATAVRSAQARAEHLARTDALTGLLNRHGMGEAAAAAVDAAVDARGVLGVLVADVDRFKTVNDTWGHAVGDQVLVLTARTLRDGVRPGDLVVRLGGEEVAVVGTWNDDDAVARAAERLRDAVEHQQGDGLPGVTVSIGTATARPSERTGSRSGAAVAGSGATEVLARLVDEADQALYAAKHAGRNRVRHSPCSGTPEAGAPDAPAPSAAPGARIGA